MANIVTNEQTMVGRYVNLIIIVFYALTIQNTYNHRKPK